MNKVRELDSDIIDREIEKAFHRANGLTMLDFRTGSGKSYDLEKNIARYIYNYRNCRFLEVGETDTDKHAIKQIIVLIPNKNNFLKHDSLADKLMEISNGEYTRERALQIVKEEMLVLKNNLDCIIQGFCTKRGKQLIWDDNKVEKLIKRMQEAKVKKEQIFTAGDIKNMKSYITEIQYYAQCRNNPNLKGYLKSSLQSANRAESNIRSLFHAKIGKYKKKEKSKKLSKAKREEAREGRETCCDIVKTFFETACFNDYHVIVTTVDKFMYPIDLVADRSVTIWDREFLPNKLVIFDESDSAYVRMRDSIINRTNESTYPYKEVLRSLICNILESTLTDTVEKAMKMAFFHKRNKRYTFENLQRRGRKIAQKYELSYAYKTDEETIKEGNLPALLNDGTLCTLNEGKKYIHAICSKKKSQVLLSVGKGPDDKLELAPGDKEIDIAGFINEGKKLIQDFGYFLLTITRSYQFFISGTEEAKEGEEKQTVSFWDCLKSILHMFSIKGEEEKFYLDLCMTLKSKPKRVNVLDVDPSFYCRGYALQLIQDNAQTLRENSILYCHDMYVTPESILLAMCQTTHVICLSATALNRSVDENFDISYLEEKLPNFYTVSEETQNALREFYAHKELPYAEGKCSFNVIALPKNSAVLNKDTPKEQTVAEFVLPTFKNELNKEKIVFRINQVVQKQKTKVPKNRQDNYGIYLQGRYFNLLHGLYDFIADPLKKSMVALEKASVSDGGSLNLTLIKQMIAFICQDVGISEEEVGLVSALSEDFDVKEREVKENWWEKGKKAIFMSTYGTTSKGSNLQYKIPDDALIRQNLVTLLPEYAQDKRFSKKYEYKDVDCLYLGNYSYLLALIEGDLLRERTECFHHVLYEIQKLAELGQISYQDKRIMEERAYRKVLDIYFDGFPYNRTQLEQTEGISNTINKIIKQSVGRIDRVNVKNKVTTIYIASENLEHMDIYELERTEKDLIPAMKAIQKAALDFHGGYNPEVAKNREEQRYLKLGGKKQTTAAKHFKQLFNTARSDVPEERDSAIAEYDRIRRLTLRYPVMTEECYMELSQEEKAVVKRYYIDSHRNDVTSYVYTYDPKEFERVKDLDRCNITLTGFNVTADGRLVSEGNTTLKKALSVNGIETIFKRKGYCTHWEPGRYILTPKGIDIYNGILGEEIEKIILQDIINDVELAMHHLEIREIDDNLLPEIFERFDFMYGNLYIDAKNWRRSVQKWNARDFMAHVKEKRELCDDFLKQKGIAVILNLYPESSHLYKDVVYAEDRYIEIRRLIDDNGEVNEEAKNALIRLFMEANTYARKNKHN